MSEFTYSVRTVDMKYRSGTKEYHLVLVQRNDGQGIAVARWNGDGKWGQIQVEKGSIVKILQFFNSKFNEKTGAGGYFVEADNTKSELTSAGMLAALGRYQTKLDRSLITYLVGTGPEPSDEFNEDFVEESVVPKRAPGESTAVINRNWGTW
ncbi:hypothetical protein [Magnetospirillum molischianum]|uniref:Uncharacterized protein n=1 Tax=Magnetospirillum molischianum DSM 120 TaxID=1150626 RepID=H8FY80_MAGML|nr:hypothetical protein [Magnetospirillum molischianum]CCG43318.1 hypothetical protein PHAMO_80109 [Magnetospirillum molischianum DSM 120]